MMIQGRSARVIEGTIPRYLCLGALLVLLHALTGAAAQAATAEGQSVLAADALLKTAVGGLERTRATARVVPVTGQGFAQALHVTIGADSPDTNVTQLTMPISIPVAKGDVLLASFSLRGAAQGQKPAQVALLFERATDPWTKSVTQGASTQLDSKAWKRVVVPFTAAESYQSGEAMVSLRLAFGPQTVEVGGLSVVDYGTTKTLDALLAETARQSDLGHVRVAVRRGDARQTLLGLGGDFCQPRYGSTEPMDAVGRYNLAHLHVAQARVGIPLNDWTPERGVFHDDAQAHAAFLQMQDLSRRGIPIIGTVWEGPTWMLPGRPEQSGRTLAPDEYADCIEAVAKFLTTARDQYGVTVEDFSFNESDAGVNFKFTPAQMAAFIAQAGPRFRALGLKTRFLAGDTTGGSPLADFAGPLLADPGLAPYIGPIAFHCWDALGAPDDRYTRIAALGKRYGKPIWCTEAGFDAQLWQAPDPWRSWDNGLRTAEAYVKTLRLSGASTMDYWTYEDNYPLVDKTGEHPYPVFTVIRQLGDALPRGAKVVGTDSSADGLQALATTGPGAGAFSVLLVSPSGGGVVTLSGLPTGASASVVVSSAEGQAVVQPGRSRVDKTGHLSVTVPPRAVVTVLGRRG